VTGAKRRTIRRPLEAVSKPPAEMAPALATVLGLMAFVAALRWFRRRSTRP
jgi:hypothetical protein